MACHFSPYGTGLTNLPPALPPGAMVILNDRVPISGHDGPLIAEQLRRLEPRCLLLDLQRPDTEETRALVRILTEAPSCPVGVAEPYGAGLDCPVFLPPPPLDTPLEEHLLPWRGREVWLEAALGGCTYRVTEQGCTVHPLGQVPDNGHRDADLFCRYRVCPAEDHADFHLWRTREDLDQLLEKAEAHGVTKAVGLWQELGR